MNLRRATFALGAACALALLGLTAQPAFATDDCVPVNASPSVWPPANAVKTCLGATNGVLVRDTLEYLGANSTDSASRLQENHIPGNETVGIVFTDPALNSGSPVTVQYTTNEADSSVTIASKLATNINASSVSAIGFASSFGTVLYFMSSTGNTSYADIDGTAVSVTLGTTSGYETATITGVPRSNQTWYLFDAHGDFSTTLTGGPVLSDSITAGAFGMTLYAGGPPAIRESSIFKNNSTDSNNVIQHVTAHETGHMLDYLYAGTGSVAQSNDATLSGTPTPGDIYTITVTDSALPGGSVSVNYTAQSGDTAGTLNLALQAAVNSDSDLSTAGISAFYNVQTNPPQLVLTSTTQNSTTFNRSKSSGATANFASGQIFKFSDSSVFKRALEIDLEKMALVQPCAYNATDGYGVVGDPPERSSGIWASADPYDQTIPLSTGGLGGMFSGAQNSQGGDVCDDRNLKSPYSGDPVNVITGGGTTSNAAYKWFGDPLNLTPNEIFAEAYSYVSGFPDTIDNSQSSVPGSDTAFDVGGFTCARLYVYTLTTYGRLPTGDELRSYGYSVPDVVGAGDPDAGAFGFGEYPHYCDGTVGELGHYGFGS